MPRPNAAPATPTSRATRTSNQVLAQQKADGERELAQKKAAAAAAAPKPAAGTPSAPAVKTTGAVVPAAKTAVAVPDNRTSVQSYLDDVAPSSIVGRMIKF